ncbi:NAD(P)H-quinone oxidoreductase [Shewanella inventionis]|uniref:Alcohol dehydrogenase n=1 Tax=Shewanella inventionis TaxID=1738770 RepID=A0ABQ1JSA1_9GAMM|nr:NAD(P)H-quinone oxidoreductase [Shewanella inventionis]MCL1159591.1 NAD(P)H-quinone oxidoreductase [Shewanella inventionis]UAL44115.1 NAD(P)H-quinone oxidoreductase [Shewanella inventionis]GGB74075.1 alcohol dehydrogenase [Shewanella inventionis]
MATHNRQFTHVTVEQPGKPTVMTMTQSTLDLPSAGQVTIKVYAAGVNGPDIKQRVGAYPPPAGASPIIGLEVAGEIIAVADDVTQWQVGDKVCALVPGGGYAELVNTYAAHCLPLPTGYSYVQAAALPETFFTVWGNLFIRAGLKAGETVLIHGGSGGIGTTAIQMASRLGAKVFATSGSAEKCQYCIEQGACVAINYNEEQFVEPILAATDGQGVNVIMDIAGGDFINENLKAIAIDGRMVSVAMQRGPQATIDIFRIMAKRVVWTGSTLRPQSVDNKAQIAQGLAEHIWPLLNSGDMNIPIDSVFPFAQVVKAHELMESGKHKGKIVLDLLAKS